MPLFAHSTRTLSIPNVTTPAVVVALIPTPPIIPMLVLVTHDWALDPCEISTPFRVKPKISHLSMVNWPPERKRMPLSPASLPLIRRFLRMTLSLAPAETTIPFSPLAWIEAIWPPPSIVIALVMVTGPYSAVSNASISPPALVLAMAASKVLHGAMLLHGLLSSALIPETKVRATWTCIAKVANIRAAEKVNTLTVNALVLLM